MSWSGRRGGVRLTPWPGLTAVWLACCAVAAGEPAPVRLSDRDKPEIRGFWDGVRGTTWQRAYDLRIGNTILIRRSTFDPPPPGTHVVFRWRNPEDLADPLTLSTKHKPHHAPGPRSHRAREAFRKKRELEGDEGWK